MTASRAVWPVVALLLLGVPVHGQSQPTFSTYALLEAHNAARARVGCPPLAWSRALAGEARRWADELLETHVFANQPNDPHGENLFMVSGSTVTPAEAVQTWIAKRRDYDTETNTCTGVCGHYTQVVWRTTREVGCAMAFDGDRQVWVCEYDPPGNVVGFRPY